MVQSAVLGFPRIGPNREIKKSVEAYWADKISADELLKAAKEIRVQNWKAIKDAGVDIIPRYALPVMLFPPLESD